MIEITIDMHEYMHVYICVHSGIIKVIYEI